MQHFTFGMCSISSQSRYERELFLYVNQLIHFDRVNGQRVMLRLHQYLLNSLCKRAHVCVPDFSAQNSRRHVLLYNF